MSTSDDTVDVSRRRVIEALVAAAPLVAAARGRLGAWRSAFIPSPELGQDPLIELGAREAVNQIHDGSLKAEAYVARLLKQYEANKDLNVVTTIEPARVLDAARAVDRARAKGQKLGPAAGLPFAIKDQIEVAGYPATGGNAALRSYVPKRNAVVVESLVQAGAIPFCMTTLPDMTVIDGLMHQASSHSESFGPVRNPYDRTRIPGGSSGGNGASLAARIVPAALGEDTNGSVRFPSACSGVCGLRPSTFTIKNALEHTRKKRYSDEGLLLPPAGRLDTIGPMARTVSDVAFLDELITGERPPVFDLRQARIAIPRPDYWDGVDSGVATVIREAFSKLREAGCTLVEIDFIGEVRSIVGTLTEPTPATMLAALGLDPPAAPHTMMAAWLREHAPGVTLDQMYRGRPRPSGQPTLPPVDEQIKILTEASHRYAEVYRSHGVTTIAFPTAPIVALRIHPDGPKEPFGDMVTINGKQVEEGKLLIQNLFIAPRMGAAGLSLPAGLAGGLPVGLELDALPGNDSALLGLGIAVQQAIGRIPPPRLT